MELKFQPYLMGQLVSNDSMDGYFIDYPCAFWVQQQSSFPIY